MTTLENLNELLDVAEHWFRQADVEEDLEPAAQYAMIAGAGASLVMAKLATELHAAALREQPVPETAQHFTETVSQANMQIAVEALRRIALIDSDDRDGNGSSITMTLECIDIARTALDSMAIRMTSDGTPNDS